MSKISCKCAFCQNELKRHASCFKKTKNAFCNHSCAAKYLNKQRNKKNSSVCLSCEKVILYYPSRKKVKKFCSVSCRNSHNAKSKIKTKCVNCEIELISSIKKIKKFCSGKCRNIINNKSTNVRPRSKVELEFEKQIKSLLPGIRFISNDRTVLDGLELDFYFPDLSAAIEFNGIWHNRDVRGLPYLNKIKMKDSLKKEKCNNKKIQLFVINDNQSSNKSIKESVNEAINLICNCCGILV